MKYYFKLVAVFLLLSLKVSAQIPAATIPDFTFYRFNKTPFTNKNLEKGRMILFIFFDTECDHCKHAIQYIDDHWLDFKKAVIYLLTLDGPDKVTAFMARYGKNLQNKKNVILLQDAKNEFITKFKPKKYPSIFLYSAERRLLRYDDNDDNLVSFSQRMRAHRK